VSFLRLTLARSLTGAGETEALDSSGVVRAEQAGYGACPECGAQVVKRTRGGKAAKDTCANGHCYPSSKTVAPAAKAAGGYSLSDTVAASGGAEVSVEAMRDAVAQACREDSRLCPDPEQGDGLVASAPSCYVCDLVQEDGGGWSAVVSCPDGKCRKVGFEYDGKSAELSADEPQEVVRQTQYVEASLCLNGQVVRAAGQPGHPFRGNQYTNEATHQAKVASYFANKDDSARDHLEASRRHEHAFEAHMEAGDKALESEPKEAEKHYSQAKKHSALAMFHKLRGEKIDMHGRLHTRSQFSAMKERGFYKEHADYASYKKAHESKVDSSRCAVYDGIVRAFEAGDYDGMEAACGGQPVRAAHGEVTGKPSVETLRQAVTQAVQEDPRWDTDSHGFPEGSEQDKASEPWCVDVLAPDDGGRMWAVVRTDQGKLVRHAFAWDGQKAVMDDGDSQPTQPTVVYTKAVEEHDAAVRAAAGKEEADAAASQAVHCRDAGAAIGSGEWRQDQPATFQWMPGGRSVIEATWNRRPIRLHVECDESAADAVQASLDRWAEAYPKRVPFGCVEHREEEASVRFPKGARKFEWRDEPEPGVFATGLPTELGAHNVNGRVHSAWSPSFTTDAEYSKAKCSACGRKASACECDGMLVFPDGVRGSESNPARITGAAFSVGTLTNKPAFRNIMPVRAKDAGGSPVLAEESGHPFRGNQWTKGAVHKFHMKDVSQHEFGDQGHIAQKHHGHDATIQEVAVDSGTGNPEHNYYDVKFANGDTIDAVSGYHLAPKKGGSVKARSSGYGTHAYMHSTIEQQCDAIFARLAAVAAAEAATAGPQPGSNKHAGNNNNGETEMKKKLVIIQARGEYKVGQEVEVEASEAAALIAGGYAQDAVQAAEVAQLKAQIKAQNEALVKAAIVRAKDRGAIPPKDEAVLAAQVSRLQGGAPVDLVVELIDTMPGAEVKAAERRLTQSLDANRTGGALLPYGSVMPSLEDALVNGYIKAREPMDAMIRRGGKENIAAATDLARESCAVMKAHVMPILAKGGDFLIKDVIRAAGSDVTDANVGMLSTGLVLMRNLGFLKNKLSFLPFISTDLRNEPALFNQVVLTRYIAPPNVLTFTAGSGYGAGTPSVPSATDVQVTLSQHKAVELVFPTTTLGSTVRNLFAEQQGAQFYALAEEVNKYFLTQLFAATWSGTVASVTSALANWSITSMVGVKNALTISKVPDVGRFCLLHSYYHDKLLEDTNLVLANTILAALNKDNAAFQSGELPVLFGVKPLESQLAAAKNGALVSLTDSTTIATNADSVGFAGNSASMVFVARVPQDYTAVLKDVPSTAAIEIVTEPDSGLSMMLVKYVNHGLAAAAARCAFMYGAAQGDSRVGVVVKPLA